MFCENCGKQVPNGAIFCAACGTKVIGYNVPQQPNFNSQMNYGGQMPYRTASQYYKNATMDFEIHKCKENIEKAAKSEKSIGIILIIWGIIQILGSLWIMYVKSDSVYWLLLGGLTLIAGFAGLIYGIESVKNSEDIYFSNYRICYIYEERLGMLIFLMISQCLMGGLIGIALSCNVCMNRYKIIKAKDIMMQNAKK
ncbi:MAG: zinc ribbon domain-containing protein [Firmicutes bacterium]|nr:zinc ribbon domain-containing protein [Bacillota bacterium]